MKIALIGHGRIARRHIDALSELEDVELVGVVEHRIDRRVYSRETDSFPFFESLEDLLQNSQEVDLISVLVESGMHKSVAMQVLDYKIPTLIEKPLALSYQDGREMTEAFTDASTPMFVVKQNRLNPATARVLDAVDIGELGRVLLAVASVLWSRNRDYYLADSWRLSRDLDGGVVWNQASHYVDLLVRSLGEIESVFAYGVNHLSPADTEDTVFATMRAVSGALGSLQATTTVRPSNFEGSLTISGTNGAVKVGGHALNEIASSTLASLQASTTSHAGADLSSVYGQSHAALYAEVFNDLKGGAKSQFRAEKTLHVLAVMEAIEKSVMERREVKISEILKTSETTRRTS